MTESNFLPIHARTYGLVVTARDPATSLAVGAVCRFCTTFGREENVGGKRKRTSMARYYSNFLTDAYLRHLEVAHPIRWKEYNRLKTLEDQEAFFGPRKASHVGPGSSEEVRLRIKRDIVEVVMAKFLFRQHDRTGQKRKLGLFKKVDKEFYEVVLKTRRRFSMCVKCVAKGLTFQAASGMMDDIRDESGICLYGGCSEAVVSEYVRIVCAHSLQILSDLGEKLWCFSLALYGSMLQEMSYLNVRINFYWKGSIRNFHVIAIPLLDIPTEANMFSFLDQCLTTIFTGSWKTKCIRVSFDGDNCMTGLGEGLLSNILAVCEDGMYGMGYMSHRLDLVLSQVFKEGSEFYSTLIALLKFLNRQENLGAEMEAALPKPASTVHWTWMLKTTAWLVEHQLRIMEYLDKKPPPWAPDVKWWMNLHAVHAFAAEARFMLSSPLGHGITVSEQNSSMKKLIESYVQSTGMMGPLSAEQIQEEVAKEPCFSSKSFVWKKADCKIFLKKCGSWLRGAIESQDSDTVSSLITSVGTLFVDVAHIISKANAFESDEQPRILPSEMEAMERMEFRSMLKRHTSRLKNHFLGEGADRIHDEFYDLQKAIKREEQFKAQVLEVTERSSTGFHSAWRLTRKRFPLLQEFIGGLASAFIHPTGVGSDFLHRGWEEDELRADLAEGSLEGISQSEQYDDLREIAQEIPLVVPWTDRWRETSKY